jgi:hypothetical protein
LVQTSHQDSFCGQHWCAPPPSVFGMCSVQSGPTVAKGHGLAWLGVGQVHTAGMKSGSEFSE